MVSKISNRQVICDKLIEFAKTDEAYCIVTSDSRGSASLMPFAKAYPNQVIEVGIAEQNLVGVSAGLALGGMKPYVASPSCFLTMRSIEQIKVDIAYSKSDVKLIGISSGVSYGALGMTHHSLQDIAVLNAIPNMTIVCPADQFETAKMMDALKNHQGPVYIRVGRSPSEDVYQSQDILFELEKSRQMRKGQDVTIIAYGAMVSVAIKASDILKEQNITVRVINMHTIKPIDKKSVLDAANETQHIVVLEEHSYYGGLGSKVAQICAREAVAQVQTIAFPDEVLITGSEAELLDYYGLNVENTVETILKMLGDLG